MLHLVDKASQLLDPLFALCLVGAASVQLKRAAPLWILKVALAVLLVQQGVKLFQHFRVVGAHFPSTHYAFALAVAGAFVALNRRFLVPVALYCVLYGAFMLVRHYHTPLEMLGALPALPFSFFVASVGTRRSVVKT